MLYAHKGNHNIPPVGFGWEDPSQFWDFHEGNSYYSFNTYNTMAVDVIANKNGKLYPTEEESTPRAGIKFGEFLASQPMGAVKLITSKKGEGYTIVWTAQGGGATYLSFGELASIKPFKKIASGAHKGLMMPTITQMSYDNETRQFDGQ